jgi:excisionase family DNA binding protein
VDPELNITLSDEVVDLIAARAASRLATRTREVWIDAAAAAAYLGCSRQRIYDLVHARASTNIPHRKEGNRLLFRCSELDQWLDSGAAGPSSRAA